MNRTAVHVSGRLRSRRPFVFVGVACALAACEAPALPEHAPILELGAVVAQLPAGARIHEVRVGAAAPTPELDPDTVRARPGDVVRFTAAGTGMHAIAFDAAALDAAAGSFLSAGQQLRGPPLLAAGASWVVSLEGAPAGAYPFLCITHGVRGILHVAP